MDVITDRVAMVSEIISPVMDILRVVVQGARVDPTFLGEVCRVQARLVLGWPCKESLHHCHRLLHQASRDPVVDDLKDAKALACIDDPVNDVLWIGVLKIDERDVIHDWERLGARPLVGWEYVFFRCFFHRVEPV